MQRSFYVLRESAAWGEFDKTTGLDLPFYTTTISKRTKLECR